MKFYSLKLKLWDDKIIDAKSNNPRVYPCANGSRIINSGDYLGQAGRIHLSNYVDDAPVFDYFYLYNLSYQSEFDWILLDAYSFAGQNIPSIRGFLVSEKFRQVLNNFKVAKPFRFYKSKLMYKGEKLDYYIFQLAQDEWKELDFEESVFHLNGERLDIKVTSNREFKKLLADAKVQTNELSVNFELNEFADIFFFSQYNIVVSENLMSEMIGAELKDFEFHPLVGVNFHFKMT